MWSLLLQGRCRHYISRMWYKIERQPGNLLMSSAVSFLFLFLFVDGLFCRSIRVTLTLWRWCWFFLGFPLACYNLSRHIDMRLGCTTLSALLFFVFSFGPYSRVWVTL
jgi:hypothetical protein